LDKTQFSKATGMSRSMLYYHHKQPDKDWLVKQQIELTLREFPSYGHKRLAMHLKLNKKRVLRVMKLFGIKPYRRRGAKWKKVNKEYQTQFPNLLLTEIPRYPNHIWASDFTYIKFKKRTVYLATVLDLFTKEVVGFSVLLNHSSSLVMNALLSAVHTHPAAEIAHSDQGTEYASKDYIALETNLGINPSMSEKGCPWENGYQESFYSQFKVDLGDPNRFNHLGELVWEIYKTIHKYNNTRIQTSLKMPPAEFAKKHYERSSLPV
jgi:transposase InsO family protein